MGKCLLEPAKHATPMMVIMPIGTVIVVMFVAMTATQMRG